MSDDDASKKLAAMQKQLDKQEGEIAARLKKAQAGKAKIDALTREADKVEDE